MSLVHVLILMVSLSKVYLAENMSIMNLEVDKFYEM